MRDRTDVLYESLVKSNRLTLMWGVPFGVGVSLFGADLVHFVIGDRWRGAILLLQVCGITAAINHVGFNWTAYFRALNRTRPIAVVTVVAAGVLLGVGIPLMLVLGLRGFAIGIAAQALAALLLRAHVPRPAVLRLLLPAPRRPRVRAHRAGGAGRPRRARLDPGHRTLGRALVELAVYALVAVAATWRTERGLLREALGSLLGRPLAAGGA